MESEDPYIGIDVSKDRLDIAVRPTGDTWSVANDASGIPEVVQRLAQLHPKLVVLEGGIGGYWWAPATSGCCSG